MPVAVAGINTVRCSQFWRSQVNELAMAPRAGWFSAEGCVEIAGSWGTTTTYPLRASCAGSWTHFWKWFGSG